MHQGIKDNSPLVSIGLPVYNSEQHIRRALGSLLAQDYENFELIISDNASTDNTALLVRNYAMRDKRIRLSANSHNIGVIKNFIKVLSMAHGKYFMWAAADDFWKPEFIKTLVYELEAEPNIGIAFCAVRREYQDGDLKDIIRFDGKYNANKASNLKLATYLLSPRKKIKWLKYNLFIYGIFRSEAVNKLLPLAYDLFNSGERAFLSPVALWYQFRYVDRVLFVKRIHEKSFQQRLPDDEVFKIRDENYYYRDYYQIMLWLAKFPMIPMKNKLFVLAIPYFIVYRFVYLRKKKLKKKLRKKYLKFFHKLPWG